MKKAKDDVLGLTKVGVLSGVGTEVVHQAGGSTAGFDTMSGFMPVTGNVLGAGSTMRAMGSLPHPKKKKK